MFRDLLLSLFQETKQTRNPVHVWAVSNLFSRPLLPLLPPRLLSDLFKSLFLFLKWALSFRIFFLFFKNDFLFSLLLGALTLHILVFKFWSSTCRVSFSLADLALSPKPLTLSRGDAMLHHPSRFQFYTSKIFF